VRVQLGIEGIVSKSLAAAFRSGPSRDWLKVKNPDSPANAESARGDESRARPGGNVARRARDPAQRPRKLFLTGRPRAAVLRH
jgi:hypothetical protein